MTLDLIESDHFSDLKKFPLSGKLWECCNLVNACGQMKWMCYPSLGYLSLTKKIVRTRNSTGAENIHAIFFRIYRVVNKTGFIKNIYKLFK